MVGAAGKLYFTHSLARRSGPAFAGIKIAGKITANYLICRTGSRLFLHPIYNR